MILITVGTHHQPFDRLVAQGERLALGGERVVIQAGPSALRPAGCEVVAFMPAERLAALMAEARVVLCHAAPSTVLECRAKGVLPLVVPRDPKFGEHVDGHQLTWASSLGGLAEVFLSADAAAARALDAAFVARFEPEQAVQQARTERFALRFAGLAAEIVSAGRVGRRGWRARVRHRMGFQGA